MNTAETPPIQKTPNVCGGEACIRTTRIPVWLLILSRRLGRTEAGQLEDYPGLTRADLDACWDYYRNHPIEIEQAIWFNDVAANVPEGASPPTPVLVCGLLLGLPAEEIQEAFDPPLGPADLAHAWEVYRANPAQIDRAITAKHRLAG